MPDIPLTIAGDDEVPDGGDVLLDGVIDGRQYRFRLDTGAARTELGTDEYTATLPAAGRHESAGVFGRSERSDIITIPGLVAGDLVLGPAEVVRAPAGDARQHLLGLDLLSRYCCEFRFASRQLILSGSPAAAAGLDLTLGPRGHIYVDLTWPGASALACWDSGAGVSAVDAAFAAAHPELFAPAGTAIGTDSTSAQASTPLLTMAGPVIAGVQFAPSTVAVFDFGPLNASAARRMNMIAGYPLLRQATWLFDLPARRCAAPVLTHETGNVAGSERGRSPRPG